MNFKIYCVYASKGCNFCHLVRALKTYDFDTKSENTYLIGDLNFDSPGNNSLSKESNRVANIPGSEYDVTMPTT